ncbi:TlpA family protein disulfide reductase [Salinibacter sp.]|uniref:TlpA family protein disulfide reductase n=1 Tax=Salinibacter sp. TaxID=2065818 RepID=UPI0021E6F266|nr:TlpA disulfide reductase family protein [Salinibacter sp.]
MKADTIRQAKEGAPVPNFEVLGLQDSTRRFQPSDFKGRYLLLNLWASWCAPCIEKLPALRTARERYSTDSLAILNVSLDRSRSDARSLLEKRPMPGQHAFVGISGLGGKFGAKFARLPGEEDMRGLPNLTLVGPDGIVAEVLPPSSKKPLLEVLSANLP